MAQLTMEQVAALAWEAGIKDQATLARAVAVCWGESGGKTDSLNENEDGSRDRGLWQINTVHKDVSDAEAFDPRGNARAMYKISNGGRNWRPWVAFMNGSYAIHLPKATLAAAKVIQSGGASVGNLINIPGTDIDIPTPSIPGLDEIFGGIGGFGGDVIGGVTEVADAIKGIGKGITTVVGIIINTAKWIADPHNWLRILEVVGGVGIAVLGVRMLAGAGVGPAQAAVDGATTATRAAKKVATKRAAKKQPAPAKKAAPAAKKAAPAPAAKKSPTPKKKESS